MGLLEAFGDDGLGGFGTTGVTFGYWYVCVADIYRLLRVDGRGVAAARVKQCFAHVGQSPARTSGPQFEVARIVQPSVESTVDFAPSAYVKTPRNGQPPRHEVGAST